jgi:hypothetical protein
VEHGAAGVGAGVDSRHDGVGLGPEPAEARAEDGEGGRAVDGSNGEVLQAGEGDGREGDPSGEVQRAEGGAGPAAFTGRRGDDHVVARALDCEGESGKPGGEDAVVVGHEYPHAFDRTGGG